MGWSWVRRAVGALAFGVAAVACIYDSNARCGANQEFRGDACVCAPGMVLVSGRACVPCPENEEPQLAECVCARGFVRGADGICLAYEGGLGRACDPDAQPTECDDPEFDYCAKSGAGEGYCTSRGCGAEPSTGCPEGYACDARQGLAYCRRAPSGQGSPCATSADCEGYEASYCESMAAKVCLVSRCGLPEVTCHGDWVCCGYGSTEQSLCLPPSALTNGACPQGGSLLED